MDTGDDIGPTYETVKEQLEEHQVIHILTR